MNIKLTLSYLLISFVFAGCLHQEPTVNLTQLELDKQALLALNESYTAKEIDSMTYLKEFRILNAKIHNEEDKLDTHDHMH